MILKFPRNFEFNDLLSMACSSSVNFESISGIHTFDFSDLDFACPCAMAGLKALLIRTHAGRNRQMIRSPVTVKHKGQDSIRYLERMDFFSNDIPWSGDRTDHQFDRHSSSGRFVPIKNLHQLSETNTASREIVECILPTGLDDLNKTAHAMTYSISELIDNALQHSESPHGAFVTAQRYEKLERIKILIADTGIGIRAHLVRNPKYQHVESHLQALSTALTPFVTGTIMGGIDGERRDYDNQGLGLSVIDEIAKKSGGELVVWSGNAYYRSASGGMHYELPTAWPGTIVYLNLPVKLAVIPSDIVMGFDAGKKKRNVKLRFNQ